MLSPRQRRGRAQRQAIDTVKRKVVVAAVQASRFRDDARDPRPGLLDLHHLAFTLAAFDAAPFDHADFRCGLEAGSSQPPSPPSWLIFNERRPAIRTLRGWTISVVQVAGTIRECEEHAWMQDRAEPHARTRLRHRRPESAPSGVSGGKPPPSSATCWTRCLPRMPPESCDPEIAPDQSVFTLLSAGRQSTNRAG